MRGRGRPRKGEAQGASHREKTRNAKAFYTLALFMNILKAGYLMPLFCKIIVRDPFIQNFPSYSSNMRKFIVKISGRLVLSR